MVRQAARCRCSVCAVVLMPCLNVVAAGNRGENQRKRGTGCIRDQLVSDIMLRAGLSAPRGRLVLLFLNGLLWGLYDLHERPDEHFCSAYFGGNDDDYDVLKHTSSTVVSGDATALQRAAERGRSHTGRVPVVWLALANY